MLKCVVTYANSLKIFSCRIQTVRLILIFVRSRNEKVQLTLIGSPLRTSDSCFMTMCALYFFLLIIISNEPKTLKRKVSIFKQQSAITSKRYEMGCYLLLLTNSKSHEDFRLVPTSVTLNNLEGHTSFYFLSFHGHQIRWLCRPITLQWLKIDQYCLLNIVFHFWPKLTHPTARSLCDS